MTDDVIKVARLICNQMQDDDCACTSACGASIYAARAAMATTRRIDVEALREEAQEWETMGAPLTANKFDRVADWLQQRAALAQKTQP